MRPPPFSEHPRKASWRQGGSTALGCGRYPVRARAMVLALTFSRSFSLLSLNYLKNKMGLVGGLRETVLLSEHSAWH